MMNKKPTTEQLLKSLEMANQLNVGREYDRAEGNMAAALGYTPDYSFQANALAGNQNVASVNTPGLEPHFADGGKLPSHPTFSDESIFSGGSNIGGHWSQVDGKDVFTPSTQQLKGLGYLDALQAYYDHEKGNGIDHVEVPPPYRNIKQSSIWSH